MLPQTFFFVGLALPEDVVVVVVGQTAAGLGTQVVAERHPERERAGQEPLLEQHRHDVAAGLGAVLFGAAVTMSSSRENISCSLLVRGEDQGLDLTVLESLAGQVLS